MGEGELDRLSGFCVDPAPDGMRVSPPVLLVKDDGAGLAGEAEALLDAVNRILKDGIVRGRTRRRAQAQREEMLPALRGPADRIAFLKRAMQVFGDEPPKLMHFDPLVLGFEKMRR